MLADRFDFGHLTRTFQGAVFFSGSVVNYQLAAPGKCQRSAEALDYVSLVLARFKSQPRYRISNPPAAAVSRNSATRMAIHS